MSYYKDKEVNKKDTLYQFSHGDYGDKEYPFSLIYFNAEEVMGKISSVTKALGKDYHHLRQGVLSWVPLSIILKPDDNIHCVKYDLNKMTLRLDSTGAFKISLQKGEPLHQLLYVNMNGVEQRFNNFKFETLYHENLNKVTYIFYGKNTEQVFLLLTDKESQNVSELRKYIFQNQSYLRDILELDQENVLTCLSEMGFCYNDSKKPKFECNCSKNSVIGQLSENKDHVRRVFFVEMALCLKFNCEYCSQDFFLFQDDFQFLNQPVNA